MRGYAQSLAVITPSPCHSVLGLAGTYGPSTRSGLTQQYHFTVSCSAKSHAFLLYNTAACPQCILRARLKDYYECVPPAAEGGTIHARPEGPEQANPEAQAGAGAKEGVMCTPV